ncbi:hypothetical protein L1987_39254 [Smallanthus sonchifolius]|uniref:Uncharacterized protein n=1 Tax=Smallanthus sonchifolius TaxID=185202 RepID=A0ACB9HMP8_9ASTR|nr:hypothetical protein L1987_39254 [Smallanthus sonchifolius]
MLTPHPKTTTLQPLRTISYLHKFFCPSLSITVKGLPSSSLAVTPPSSPSSNTDTMNHRLPQTQTPLQSRW